MIANYNVYIDGRFDPITVKNSQPDPVGPVSNISLVFKDQYGNTTAAFASMKVSGFVMIVTEPPPTSPGGGIFG